ncbi:TPA: glycosyltransferase family 2 protein [Vibrio cholerae]|nr:glycosyltransferase family 2 protein [Vibrio cholerae]
MKKLFDDALISVVMPLYNSENFVSESIESVLAQSYSNFELIIVDNLSSDSSLSIALGYSEKDSRIKVFECRVKGASHARNLGISKSKGRFLAFIDSDDLWKNDKLRIQLDNMIKYGFSLSCTSYQPFERNFFLKKIRFVQGGISYSDLLRTCDVGCSTVMIDRKFHRHILFPCIPKEDYALWLELTKSGTNFGCCNDVLTFYRVYDNSVSSNKIKELTRQWNIYRHKERISLIFSIFCILNYIYYGLKKRG